MEQLEWEKDELKFGRIESEGLYSRSASWCVSGQYLLSEGSGLVGCSVVLTSVVRFE